LLRVSLEGEILREVSVIDIFFKNGLQSLLFANGQAHVTVRPDVEVFHLNDIEELPSSLAEVFPLFSAGDVVLSFRTQDLIMVVDPVTLKVKWHQTGPYLRQHDPDFQPDGTLTIFDNRSGGYLGDLLGGSRILRLDPISREVAVLYGGREDQPLYTDTQGEHQVLENGNLLITETEGGRVIEVTRDGEIVWEYINRFNAYEVAPIYSALRYPDGYFLVQDWGCG
jgi:hypothetical protein